MGWHGRVSRLPHGVALVPVLAVLGASAVAMVQPVWPPSRVVGDVRVEPARLRDHVVWLSSAPRSHQHVERLDVIARRLAASFRAAGARVEEQTFVPDGETHTYRNVVARFGPDTGDVIVVGAHYDAHGTHPGADDDASGVAALLELAPLLATAPLARSVELVAYTLEEPPYFGTRDMGSAHHAAIRGREGVVVTAMLSLEMLGYYADSPGTQRYPHVLLGALYPRRGDFLAVVGRFSDSALVREVKRGMLASSDLPVWSLCGPRTLPGVDWSDHRSYWDAGVPAVMITDTSFFRNDRYHTARDTPDSLDYERLAKAVVAVRGAVLALAGR